MNNKMANDSLKIELSDGIRYTTVAQLIEALRQFPADATIGVRASCCSHAHTVNHVRTAGKGDWDDESDVILDTH